jgi:hypothetical protein
MAQPFDITAYSFQASLVCPACIVGLISGGGDTEPVPVPPGLTAEEGLTVLAAQRGIDRMSEHTFDSDQFPKIVFRDQLEDTFSGLPERCEVCGELLED